MHVRVRGEGVMCTCEGGGVMCVKGGVYEVGWVGGGVCEVGCV